MEFEAARLVRLHVQVAHVQRMVNLRKGIPSHHSSIVVQHCGRCPSESASDDKFSLTAKSGAQNNTLLNNSRPSWNGKLDKIKTDTVQIPLALIVNSNVLPQYHKHNDNTQQSQVVDVYRYDFCREVN